MCYLSSVSNFLCSSSPSSLMPVLFSFLSLVLPLILLPTWFPALSPASFPDRRLRGIFHGFCCLCRCGFSGFHQLVHRLLYRFHRFAVDRLLYGFLHLLCRSRSSLLFLCGFHRFFRYLFLCFWAVFVVFFAFTAFTASSVFPAGFPFFPVFFSAAAFAAVFAFALLLLAAPVSGFV